MSYAEVNRMSELANEGRGTRGMGENRAPHSSIETDAKERVSRKT